MPGSPNERRPFEITYESYLDSVKKNIGREIGSEGGGYWQPIDEDTWNSLSNRERYENLGMGMDGIAAENYWGYRQADEDSARAFRERFGESTWDPNLSGSPDLRGQLVYGYTDASGTRRMGPNGDDPSQFAIDPARILVLEDGRWVMEADNISGAWLQQAQATDDRRGNQHMTRAAVAIAAMAAGGYLMGADTAAVAGTAGTGTGISATGTAGVGVGATGEATIGLAEAIGTTAGTTAGTTGTTAGTAGTTAAGTTPGFTAVAEGTTGVGVEASTSGIVNSANPGLVQQAWDGYNSLSPASRAIVNAGISGVANAALQGNAQRNAQQAQEEAEERQREDRVRRGSIPAFGSAFTPRPRALNPNTPNNNPVASGGIISSRRGG